jgi:anti-sigma-K factor RskA
VGFWRSFGLLAGGVAAVLFAAFLFVTPGARLSEPEIVAVLVSPAPANEARMVVALQGTGTLRISNVRGWKSVQDAGRALELWAVPKEGAPRSLGLVANVAGNSVIRIDANDARMEGVTAFALSSEPPGGSPTHAPTGPVLCSGMVGKLRKA